MRVYTGPYFLPIPLENFFCFCFSALFVFPARSKFGVIFINFCNICIIIVYIVGLKYSVFLFSFIISHNLWEQISRHENLITALNKNMPTGSFWVLKVLLTKKNVEYLPNERLRQKRYQQIVLFLKKFKKWKLYFEPLVLASL